MPELRIRPQGQCVILTGATNGQGTAVPLYTDAALSTAATLPLAVTADVTLYSRTSGPVRVTVVQSDGTLLVDTVGLLTEVTPWVVSPVPSPEQVAADVSPVTVTVRPSGDTSGVTDRARINAATANAPGRAVGVRTSVTLAPGEWSVDDAMLLYSRQTLTAYGAKVTRVGTAGNVIRNFAALPTRIVTDAAVTSGSATVTSASGGFAGAVVGTTRVGVIGAGPNGSVHYGVVNTVAGDGTSVTLSITADTTVSAARADVFDTIDEDITVQGGHFRLAVAPLDGHQPTATYLNSFVSAFRRISNLRVLDTTWSSAGAAGEGGKYVLCVGDCSDVVISNTHFAGTSGDGVHLSGPIYRALVDGVTGTTGDDMVVAGTQDNNTQYVYDTQGPIVDWHTRGVVSNGSWCAWKIYDLGTLRKHRCANITVENISGTTQVQMVSLLNVTCNSVKIRNVQGAPGATFPMVISASEQITETDIDGLTWHSTSAASKGLVRLEKPRNIVRLRHLAFSQAPSGTNYFVQVTGQLNGSTWGLRRLEVDGLHTPKQTGSGSAVTFGTLNGIEFASDISGTSDETELAVRNVHCTNITAGTLVNKGAVAVVSRMSLQNVTWSGTQLVAIPSGDASARVSLTNVKMVGTRLLTTASPVVVVTRDVHAVCSSAAFDVTGSGSLTVEHGGSWSSTGANTTTFSRSASQALRVNGAGLPAVLADLTPTTGDIVTASALAGTIPAGTPAVRGSSSWVGLAGGTL